MSLMGRVNGGGVRSKGGFVIGHLLFVIVPPPPDEYP
jgi:hypothetical protein